MKIINMSSLLLLITLFFSCRKEDSPNWDESVLPTIENVSGLYRVRAAYLNGTNVFNNPSGSFNLYALCERDDVYRFGSDMTYTVVDQGKVCDPSNNEVGYWSLADHYTMMINDDEANIHYFNGRRLIITHRTKGVRLKISFERI